MDKNQDDMSEEVYSSKAKHQSLVFHVPRPSLLSFLPVRQDMFIYRQKLSYTIKQRIVGTSPRYAEESE